MKISGLQKTSIIDYPGKIVSIIFTQGCNYKCPYCHNSQLIPMNNTDCDYLPQDYLFSFLEERKGLIDGVSISGGEPTIQKDLVDLVIKIKSMDLMVKLDTNGSIPEVIAELIGKNIIDYLAMDIKGSLNKYKQIAGKKVDTYSIKKSIKLIINSNMSYEFRTTVVPTLHERYDFYEIRELIKGADNYFIQNFRPVNTLNPNYLKLKGFPVTKLSEFKDIIKSHVNNVEIRN